MDTRQDPPPNEDKLEFPIRRTEKAFKQAARGKLTGLTMGHLAIVESAQIYSGQGRPASERFINDSLDVLSQWAMRDRTVCSMLLAHGHRARGRSCASLTG